MLHAPRTLWTLAAVAVTSVLAGAASSTEDPRAALIAARRLAYDGNFQNDQRQMREAIDRFDALAADADVGAFARYYAGWTRWSLAGSEIQAGDREAGLGTLDASVRDLRKAAERRPDDPDFLAALAFSLISIASIDRARLPELAPEISTLRRKALDVGPDNPRVVMVDAGLIFYNPPETGGGQEKGIARYLEAIRLFEQETRTNPLAPDWGRAEAHGWIAQMYLMMDPPRVTEARRMAERALALRPDFWYVRTQILPRLAAPDAAAAGAGPAM